MVGIPKNLSNSALWDSLYDEFRSNICHSCFTNVSLTRDMSYPQPIPYIGSDFGKDPFSIFFCGIETYCNSKREERIGSRYDVFPAAQVESLYFEKEPEKNNYSLFWKWVRAISEGVLSEYKNPFAHIAYSNLVKCQSRPKGKNFCSSSYALSSETAANCISKAGWIYREIREIGAKNIIVFSGIKWKFYLARLFLDDEEGKMIRKFDYDSVGSRQEIREKRKNTDLFIHLRDENRRFIITNHPNYTPHEIRDEIIRIIRENDWGSSLEWKNPKPLT